MTLTSEEEDLAVALWAERTHGERAPVWIAEQIGMLALQGDSGGVARWKAIAGSVRANAPAGKEMRAGRVHASSEEAS